MSLTDALRQAEAEAADAEAEAAAARARAHELRQRRAAAASPTVLEAQRPTESPAEAAEVDEDTESTDADESTAQQRRRFAVRRPQGLSRSEWLVAGVAAAVTAVLALTAGSGYFLWQDRQMGDRHQLQAEYAAAARQGVVNLMSLDFNNAQSDIQRVIDSTTGEFHDDFASSTDDFLTVMQESKVVTTASVNATAVDSMTTDSAVVLVAASSQVANSVSNTPNPRVWRLSVTVNKVDDQIKMSKVEFVP